MVSQRITRKWVLVSLFLIETKQVRYCQDSEEPSTDVKMCCSRGNKSTTQQIYW